MKFKHFTMGELKKMTQDQQRGYLIDELTLGAGKAIFDGIKEGSILQTTESQMRRVKWIEDSFSRIVKLLTKAMAADTKGLDVMLKLAVGAPKALNYK